MSSKVKDEDCLTIPSHVLKFYKRIDFAVEMGKNERIGTPRNNLTTPEKDSGIMVLNAPAHLLEDYLFPYFEQAGPIHKFRILLKTNKASKGVLFITYRLKQGADNCIELFDCKSILGNDPITVQRALDNKRLFVGGIPSNKSRDDVWHELARAGMEAIVDVIMYKSYTNKNKNRGFVFVEFNSHEEAEIARKGFKDYVLFGQRIIVDWSSPLVNIPDDVKHKVTVVFMKNIDQNQTLTEFKQFIGSALEGLELVDKVYKYTDYALIRFKTRRDAQKGMWQLKSHFKLMRYNITVGWAKQPANISEMFHENPNSVFTSGEFRFVSLPSCECKCKHSSDSDGHHKECSPSTSSSNNETDNGIPNFDLTSLSLDESTFATGLQDFPGHENSNSQPKQQSSGSPDLLNQSDILNSNPFKYWSNSSGSSPTRFTRLNSTPLKETSTRNSADLLSSFPNYSPSTSSDVHHSNINVDSLLVNQQESSEYLIPCRFLPPSVYPSNQSNDSSESESRENEWKAYFKKETDNLKRLLGKDNYSSESTNSSAESAESLFAPIYSRTLSDSVWNYGPNDEVEAYNHHLDSNNIP